MCFPNHYHIYDNAFRGCIGLENILLPNSLRYIRDGAFSQCDNLTIRAYPQPYSKLSPSFGKESILIGAPIYTGEYLARTQTTLKFKVSEFANCEPVLDTEEKISIIGVTIGNYGYSTPNRFEYKEGDEVTIQKLEPGVSHSLKAYTLYSDGEVAELDMGMYSTLDLGEYIKLVQTTPTTITIEYGYAAGDALIRKTRINGKETNNAMVSMSGLDPYTSYPFEYEIEYYIEKINGSYKTKVVKENFKTLPLELETLKPRVVSSTNAIVAASTNISDVETNVGFQWKKYDAPASLAPNEGYAAIYDGQLEGYIKNLQPTSYYNVRAFYKSASDKYYYSDWVTFDPSDFSYFEPTVHTYPVESSSDGSVKVKGYVLAGTDDITEQGFEYWGAASGAKARRMLAETPAGPVSKIFATGQVMTATLTDLAPSTTYTLRAFVTTVAGVTYGEEQTFTTPADAAGIIGIDSGMSEPEVTGYYDLNGRRHDEPFSGLNIIRYSDGTARKVFFK